MSATVAHLWIQIPRGTFTYDGRAPPGARVGYCLQVSLRAASSEGIDFHFCFRPHDPASGEWPCHYTVMDVYSAQVFHERHECTSEFIRASYGWLPAGWEVPLDPCAAISAVGTTPLLQSMASVELSDIDA